MVVVVEVVLVMVVGVVVKVVSMDGHTLLQSCVDASKNQCVPITFLNVHLLN